MGFMGFEGCNTRLMFNLAFLLLLLHAAAGTGTALVRIVSPQPPSHGQYTCKNRVLHVRAAASYSSSSPDSDKIAFFVDGQQLATVTARSYSEVPIIPFVSVHTYVPMQPSLKHLSLGWRRYQGHRSWRAHVAGRAFSRPSAAVALPLMLSPLPAGRPHVWCRRSRFLPVFQLYGPTSSCIIHREDPVASCRASSHRCAPAQPARASLLTLFTRRCNRCCRCDISHRGARYWPAPR
jgi:hypothetical protein